MPAESPRVLHVADFAAPYRGAFIRQLELLDDELRRRGGSAAYAFPPLAAQRDWFAELLADGRDVVTLPPASPRHPLRGWQDLALAAERGGRTVVHSHFGSYDFAAAGAAWARRRRGRDCAVVWHYRTALETPIAQRSLGRRAKDGLKFGLVGRRVDACLGVTEALAEEVRARGVGDRARPLVSGCDTERFRPDAETRACVRADLGIADDEIVVLHLGWHWQRKGGDLLAEAARRLGSRGVTGLRYLSLGAPPDVVTEPVEALPFTPRPQDLQCASDVFVSASRSEGFGNGLVEALACERVAVATLVEGHREIFDGLPGVVGIPAEDADALADGLERLLGQRDHWEQWGREHRRHIEEGYGLGAWARRMADVYAALEAAAAARPRRQPRVGPHAPLGGVLRAARPRRHVVTCGGCASGGDYAVHDLGRPWPGRLGYLFKLPSARRRIRALEPDVVHAHYATSYGALALAAGRRPLVVTAHGDDVLIAPASPLLRPLVRRVLRAADLITVPAEHMRAAVERLVGAPSAPILVFQYGVDTGALAALSRAARAESRSDAPLRIAACGRCSPSIASTSSSPRSPCCATRARPSSARSPARGPSATRSSAWRPSWASPSASASTASWRAMPSTPCSPARTCA